MSFEIVTSGIDRLASILLSSTEEQRRNRQWLVSMFEAKTFTIGIYSLTVHTVGRNKSHIIEKFNNITYEHHNRTHDVLFDFIYKRMQLYKNLHADRCTDTYIELVDTSTSVNQMHALNLTRLDVLDVVCHYAKHLTEQNLHFFDNRLELIYYSGKLILSQRNQDDPLDVPRVQLILNDNLITNTITHQMLSDALCISQRKHINEIESYMIAYFNALKHSEMLSNQCIMSTNDTISDDLHVLINSNKTDITYECKQYDSDQNRVIRISKSSSKSYLVESYEQYSDGTKYWSFYRNITGVNQRTDDFISLVRSVYNAYK